MTASCAPRKAPPPRPASPFSSWSFVGILLVVQVLLLPTSSDACGDPPRFGSMMLKGLPKTVYLPGDRIIFKCRLGYKPVVPPLTTSTVCQPDNTWAPFQEVCTRKLCPQLGEPQNGQIIYINGTFEFGPQAYYVCNEGYYLIGTKIIYCELSGDTVDWSDSPTQCEKVLCQPPGKISNRKYTNNHKDTFEYNEVVTYSCNPSNGPDEYSLVGESKLICSGHNTWSSDPTECKGLPGGPGPAEDEVQPQLLSCLGPPGMSHK
ncbi:LOW QUALITY PROTEIN: membrane cofactor protein-like [Rhinolophus ferrumequinum]|uniref:LOW QUALITY PROTEIN: membrane cofactor protein-like n=1 Tax=Rhinolophus ferrumequinum TaxID=59479 RepID=UPI00140F7327|nr:LOW QUALITY PROTEIN: membrane cofactor protein-like [Rhinolophus ferrumequinum]